jgi:hypothetical protein
METMIKKIEDAVVERLKSMWPKPGVAVFDVDKGFASTLNYPAICVTTERIGFESTSGLSADYYTLEPIISIYAAFKSLKPDDRRAGAYILATLIPALLVGKKLGLDIEPLKPAGQIVEIFHETIGDGGLAAFKIELKTSFELAIEDDGELTKLLVTANDYLYRDYEFKTQVINHANEEGINEGSS